jgi:hypothetical protein
MSFYELIAGYPWLTKRIVRVMNPAASLPRWNCVNGKGLTPAQMPGWCRYTD